MNAERCSNLPCPKGSGIRGLIRSAHRDVRNYRRHQIQPECMLPERNFPGCPSKFPQSVSRTFSPCRRGEDMATGLLLRL